MMQRFLQALKRVFGALCVVLGALAGLFAIVGYFIEGEKRNFTIVMVLASGSCLLLVAGARVLWVTRSKPRARRAVPQAAAAAAVAERSAQKLGRRKYDEFAFGDPPPSSKQIGYAMSLGVEIKDGMTKWMMSDAIGEAIERQRDHEPAASEQLREIRQLRGVLPRAITRGEARRVIEFLDNHSLPCPFCGIEVCACDNSCCACDRSLKRMRIPIFID